MARAAELPSSHLNRISDEAAARRLAATKRILEGPIAPTLVRLAAPNILLVFVQTAVAVVETWLAGRLGTASLAALALVFPFAILMQMMSAGSMGGGVSSATARALGAGDVARAEALMAHAIVIAIAMSVLFTLIPGVGGRWLYRWLGAEGDVLGEAVQYAAVLFGGALAIWIANILASVLRGAGNMAVPSFMLIGVAVVQIPLAAGFMLGLGPLPRLGLAGAGLAQVIAFAGGAVAVSCLLRSGRIGLRLRLSGVPLRWALFRDILSVGAVACLSSLQAALSVSVITGLVAAYGTAALAGYGVGARLEFMQVPLIFAIGATLVAMVGTNVGAGNWRRARRIAWTGAVLAAGLTGTIGIAAALAPAAWIGLFSSDAAVHAAGAPYLRIVGPFYGFLGLGFALYFASQGMARVLGTVLAGTARLVAIAVGGWLVVHFTYLGIDGLFAVIAIAMNVFGVGAALAVAAISRSSK